MAGGAGHTAPPVGLPIGWWRAKLGIVDRISWSGIVKDEISVRGGPGATFTISLLILCYVLSNIDRQIVSVLANDIKADFALSDSELGALQGFTFTAFYAVAGIPMARLIDGVSRVRLAAAFVGLWSVMTLLCGMAGNFLQLLLYRAGTACAEAGLPTASLSIFADLLERRRLAWVSALLMTAPYLGGGLALLAGGWLLDEARWLVASGVLSGTGLTAWKLVFLAVGLPGIGLGILMWFTLREPRRRQIATAEAVGEEVPRTSAVVGLLVQRKAFWLPFMLAVPFMVLTLFAQIAWMPAVLMREYHLSASAAGLLVGPLVLVLGVVGSLLSGLLIARQGDRAIVSYCVSLMARVACLAMPLSLLYFVPMSLPAAVIAYAAQIFLLAIFTATWPLTIQLLVPNRIRARAIAIVNLTGALIGQGMGPFVVGLINDRLWLGSRLQLSLGCTVSLSLGVAAIAAIMARKGVGDLDIAPPSR